MVASELRDLKPVLIENPGLYRQYQQYRQHAKAHESHFGRVLSFEPPMDTLLLGSVPAGPPGITKSLLHAARPHGTGLLFEDVYPTHEKFMWHHTVCYWTGVLFVQGSLLFTFASGVELFKERLRWAPTSVEVLTLWPNLVGAVMFEVGAYCQYLNLINLPRKKGERFAKFRFDWEEIRKASDFVSRFGTMCYFVGATIFGVGVVTPFFDLTGSTSRIINSYVLVTMPGLIGSVCFVMGGICEIYENGVFCCGHKRTTCRDRVWWVSLLNTAGGLNFLVGYLPGALRAEFEGAELVCSANFFVGSVIFTLTSWLSVVMWRHQNFGLALIRQLNDVIGSGEAVTVGQQGHGQVVHIEVPQEAEVADNSSISIQSAVFIGMYCWLSCAAIVNIMCDFLWDHHSALHEKHPLRMVSQQLTGGVIALCAQLVLGVHSTIVSVPKHEPYRSLIVIGRFALFVAAVSQTLSFLDFLQKPLH